jgi:hypothetical protein
LKSSGFEFARLGNEKVLMSCEKLGRTGITDDTQGSMVEILIGDFHGARVSITPAGHLA